MHTHNHIVVDELTEAVVTYTHARGHKTYTRKFAVNTLCESGEQKAVSSGRSPHNSRRKQRQRHKARGNYCDHRVIFPEERGGDQQQTLCGDEQYAPL